MLCSPVFGNKEIVAQMMMRIRQLRNDLWDNFDDYDDSDNAGMTLTMMMIPPGATLCKRFSAGINCATALRLL